MSTHSMGCLAAHPSQPLTLCLEASWPMKWEWARQWSCLPASLLTASMVLLCLQNWWLPYLLPVFHIPFYGLMVVTEYTNAALDFQKFRFLMKI